MSGLPWHFPKNSVSNSKMRKVLAAIVTALVQQAGNRVLPMRQGAFCDPPVNYQLTVSLE